MENKGNATKIIAWKKDIFTIPNKLNLFHILLEEVIYSSEITEKREVMIILLLLSAFTDFVDGRITRRLNMISELGKILNPIADKLTQEVLLLGLLSIYKVLQIVFILFLIEESYMAVVGMKVIANTNKNGGELWYGSPL